MNIQELRQQVEFLDSLPAIPPVVRKLLRTIDSPTLSLTEMGEMIAKDQALTAKLLKIVNSPVYGFPGRISSVSQSLILLGLNVMKGLLFGVSVSQVMEQAMIGLWEHSIGTAVTAKAMASKKGLSEPEEVMTSALLHDIGKVALKVKFPAPYADALLISKDEGLLIRESEERIFSVSHAEAGSWLARKWNFPVSLIDPIAYHHRPTVAKAAPLQTAIVHVSDILIRARGIGFAGEHFVPAVDPKIWEALSLSDRDIKELLRSVDETIEEVEDVLTT
jgi:putative nucleotidyltransferase with HDIG domain